jgi:hypothetical protein
MVCSGRDLFLLFVFTRTEGLARPANTSSHSALIKIMIMRTVQYNDQTNTFVLDTRNKHRDEQKQTEDVLCENLNTLFWSSTVTAYGVSIHGNTYAARNVIYRK